MSSTRESPKLEQQTDLGNLVGKGYWEELLPLRFVEIQSSKLFALCNLVELYA